MNVWECLWNIDECVMKQSRQAQSKEREKESDRERGRAKGCTVYLQDNIWPSPAEEPKKGGSWMYLGSWSATTQTQQGTTLSVVMKSGRQRRFIGMGG